jgi:hypothetical protein
VRADIQHKHQIVVLRLKVEVDFLAGMFRGGRFHAMMPQAVHIAKILGELSELHSFGDVVVQTSNGVGGVDDELRKHVHELGRKLLFFLQSYLDRFVHIDIL